MKEEKTYEHILPHGKSDETKRCPTKNNTLKSIFGIKFQWLYAYKDIIYTRDAHFQEFHSSICVTLSSIFNN